jgi:hypothetical protein
MSKDFDSQLDSIIGAHKEKQKRINQEASDQQAATEEFYRAWNQHRANVVAPTLNEIVAALAGKGVAADARDMPQGYGVALYVSTGDPRLAQGYGVEGPCLTFKAVSWQCVQIEYPPFHKEEYPLSSVTRELIEAKALKFVREIFGKR